MMTLVVLPGMNGSGLLLKDFAAAMGPEFDVIVVEYPSSEPLDYAGLEKVARASLPNDRVFFLIAESFSGPIAISIAASAPPGLLGLILCASFASNPRPVMSRLLPLSILPVRNMPAAIACWFTYGSFVSADRRSAFRQAISAVSGPAMKARVRAVVAVDVSAKIKHLQVPVLYLRGAADRLIPRDAFKKMHRQLPSMQLIELAAPHFILQTVPEAAALAVGQFALRAVNVAVTMLR